MLNELFLALMMAFGWVQAADVHDAFTLFKEGKYQEATKLIIKSKMYDVLDARDEHENTLLTAAIVHGDSLDSTCTEQEKFFLIEDAVNWILDKTEFNTIYVDRRDTNWQTPLIHAVKKGYDELAEYLYIHNATPRIKDIYGKTARDYAQTNEMRQALMSWEWESLEMMREATNIWGLLHRGMYRAAHAFTMARFSDLELISMRDRLGNSLIMAPIVFSFSISQDMSYLEKEELIIQLLEDVYERIEDHESRLLLLDVQNRQGKNAMMWAAKYGHEKVIKWLHDRGADMLLKDNRGRMASDFVSFKQLKDQLEDWQVEQQIGWRVEVAAS